MKAEHYAQALLEIWDELPALLGLDAWLRLLPELTRFLARVGAEPDPKGFLRETARLSDIIGDHYPTVRNRLSKVLEDILHRQRSDGQPEPVPARDALTRCLEAELREHRTTRYADIEAPRKIALGERAAVSVRLTVDPDPDSRAPAPVAAAAGTLEVALHSLSGSELEILPPSSRPLTVGQRGDFSEVVFYFKGRSERRHELLVDFRQQGLLVGRARFEVEVRRQVEALSDSQHCVAAMKGLYKELPRCADLEIHVFFANPERPSSRLRYLLHSPHGIVENCYYRSIPGKKSARSLEQFRRRLSKKISALNAGKTRDGHLLLDDEIVRKLDGLGRWLYEELFPKDLQAAYKDFERRVETIQIVSDEPWIPWELIKPYEDSGPGDPIDSDFLCAKFKLTRWLSERTPLHSIKVASLACIEAGKSPDTPLLPFAKEERDFVVGMAVSDSGVEDRSPSESSAESLRRLLEKGGLNLLHIVAHGDYSVDEPDESPLLFPDGSTFSPEDLLGPLQTRIKHDHPLVFLNACRSGQIGWALTGLGGWAERWVRTCQGGAFIGALWNVSDKLAFEFAKTFYQVLCQGHTFAEAAHQARLHVRELDPSRATWLSYVVYAHPNGKLRFAGVTTGEAMKGGENPRTR